MSFVLGLVTLYGIPGVLAWAFWRFPIRRLIALWVGRDVMLSFIPAPKDVHHSERILRLAEPTPSTTLRNLITEIRNNLR